jgi:hypothetical protein
MGAKSGERIVTEKKVKIIGQHGQVAQLLHPILVARDDIETMSHDLQLVEEQLSLSAPNVKLVISGGGLIEIYLSKSYTRKSWKSEDTLNELIEIVQPKIQRVAAALRESRRDYILGVDVFDVNNIGGGQFAVLVRAGEVKTIVWKSYPVGEESKWLAGFGTEKGMNSPRMISTVLGKTMLLVCHDAQAYNHRNQALVSRAHIPTPRQKVIENMKNMIKIEKPEWAFNLIHRIEKQGSINPFRNSYNQIHKDHQVSAVVGAFGYGSDVKAVLEKLAKKAQSPEGKSGVVVILEVCE